MLKVRRLKKSVVKNVHVHNDRKTKWPLLTGPNNRIGMEVGLSQMRISYVTGKGTILIWLDFDVVSNSLQVHHEFVALFVVLEVVGQIVQPSLCHLVFFVHGLLHADVRIWPSS